MLGLTFGFSGDAFSGQRTGGLIRRLLSWSFPQASDDTVALLNFLIRKAAHFIEYALLAWLVYRALRRDRRREWRHVWAAFSLLAVIGWAALDEYSQSLKRSRDGSLYDVIIDAAGGIVALAIIWLRSKRPPASPD
jgi:VanZ family protein